MSRSAIELIARGVCVQSDHLLVCRNRRLGHAFLPGGHVELGETAANALSREMEEETGMPFRIGRFVGGCEAIFEQQHRKGPRHHHEVNLIFEMQPAPATSSPQALASSDALEYRGSAAPTGDQESAATSTPAMDVPSREAKIAFEWLAIASLRCDADTDPDAAPLLPRGIIPLVLAVSEAAKSGNQASFPALWATDPPGLDRRNVR